MMELKNASKILFFALIPAVVFGQIATEEFPVGSIFKKHFYTGPQLTTIGLGIQYEIDRNITYKRRLGIALSLGNVKSQKEYRKSNPQYDDSKSYIYGKVNSLVIGRVQVQYTYLLFEKKRNNGIKIHSIVSAGALFGWLKPNYVKILDPFSTEKNVKPVDELYNPEVQQEPFVFGRSSYFMGFDQGKKQCGITAKAGVLFDFSKKENQIIGLEFGLQYDRFSSPVQLFYKGKPFQNSPSLYTSLIIGLNRT